MKTADRKNIFTCVLISDFNLQNFAAYIGNDPDLPGIKPIQAPFGQVEQILMDPNSACWRETPDAALVWTRPQSVSAAFKQLLEYRQIRVQDLLDQVDEFASKLIEMSARVNYVFVPTWAIPPYRRIFGLLDMKTGAGLTNALLRMNLRLIERLEPHADIHVMDTHKWIARTGPGAFSPKLWYLGKIEYGNALFKEAAANLKSALGGALGHARKLIIVDLDDTLWGGIVGDIGWENLVLGGHHPAGEAYADFQRVLKSLQHRGIILGIVSKNEAQVALEAIGRHPEMVLRPEDFAGWRINWRDKAQNIVDLLAELNLGPQSAVFIDDNPIERARVSDSLPEVLVPDWPGNPLLYASTLLDLTCFDLPSLTREDVDRPRMYLSENKRRGLKESIGSLDEWLAQLSIEVRIDPLGDANLQRATQLLNKTNQMNLSTRRMSAAELRAWADHKSHKLWTLRVSDKFGDSGLTGILSVEVAQTGVRVVDFILSCRVMGRRIEDLMLAVAVDYARGLGLEDVSVDYIPTPKNKPCLDFFRTQAPSFEHHGNTFRLRKDAAVAYPEHIKIAGKA